MCMSMDELLKRMMMRPVKYPEAPNHMEYIKCCAHCEHNPQMPEPLCSKHDHLIGANEICDDFHFEK